VHARCERAWHLHVRGGLYWELYVSLLGLLQLLYDEQPLALLCLRLAETAGQLGWCEGGQPSVHFVLPYCACNEVGALSQCPFCLHDFSRAA
jgi:hypothetical protein